MSIDHVNLRRLDLNLLLAFDALMRTQSVSDAAARLSVGQPAMSHSLRRLRELFADDLLQREGGRLRPTDMGLTLWEPVRAALEGLETGLDVARSFDPKSADRVYRLAMPDYLAAIILPGLLSIAKDARGLQFRIESPDSELGTAGLAEGRLDAFIGILKPADWIDETPLFEDSFVTLFDPTYWHNAPETLDDFCAAPHLLVSQIDGFTGFVDGMLAQQGRSRRVVASVSRFGDGIAAVEGTRFLLTLPKTAAKGALEKGRLSACEPAIGQRRFMLNLYRRKRSIGAPASQWITTKIQELLARQVIRSSGVSKPY